MRPPLAAVLPALLLAALPAPDRPAAAQGKPPPAGAEAPPPSGGKPPALSDLPDPAPRRPGPPAPGGGPAPRSGPSGKPAPLGPNEGPTPRGRDVSSGTGFVIGERQVMTNDHVIRDCRSIRARTPQGREIQATVRAQDSRRDLALLDLREAAGPPLAFRSGPDVRLGDSVVTYGFPLAGLLSAGPTLTTGDISALAGLSNNRAHFQISAPVQPGNSGGPLLDLAGNVVGIITSKLNAQRVAQRTGDIPQNVNFAVKGEEALAFLRENRVQPRTAASGTPRTAAEVGEAVNSSVLFLRCLG